VSDSSYISRRGFLSGLVAAGIGMPGCDGDRRSPPGAGFEGFDGIAIRKGSPDYELWRNSMSWQLRKPARFPEVIVRPTGAAQVSQAVRMARSEGLKVTARSGGHHIWGSFLRDGGMLVDMSRFRDLAIDAERGIAEVGPALWSDGLMRGLAAQDYAFPVAHCASLPMGGYLPGGGLGINGDEWGPLACFSIVGAEVVTADGEQVTVSETENEDLFWALRGAGHGFFGIVTRYRLKLYRLPRAIRVGVYVYPLDRLREIADWLHQAVGDGLPKTELLSLLLENPEASSGEPPEARKICVVRPAVFADSDEEAERILAPLTSHPLAKQAAFATGLQPTSMRQLLQESVDLRRGFGFGRYAVDTLWARSPRDALETIGAEFVKTAAWKSHVVVTFKSNTELPADAALSKITDTWIGSYAVWDRAEDDPENIAWLRATSAAMQPFAAGHSINEIDTEVDPDKVRRCFTDAAWERLAALREARDPDHLFNNFQNIKV
jgi:FAD/FMN-containing dehydrogenase